MSGFFVVIVLLLLFIIVVQIAKASEYVAILKGEKKTQEQNNRLHATLMLVFLIVGLIGLYVCHELLKDKLLPVAASVQGVAIDHMMTVTLVITGIVFFITQILLFVFAYKYRGREGHQASYYHENSKIEFFWTAIPALTMTILVAIGLKHWFTITSAAPPNAMVVEVTGKQFNWMFRYPGKDGVLGKKDYRLIDEGKFNPLGQVWSDPYNHDDVVSSELHLVVGRPVKLEIGSRDVIHDVGLPYFRLKMDAVPGVPTTLWFTPKYTTAQMAKMTGDPNFVYKLVCDQLCGAGHYSMVANIVVETQQEFDQWLASQKSQYQLAKEGGAIPSDSTRMAMLPVSSKKPDVSLK